MNNNLKKIRNLGLDQFYTNLNIVKFCLNKFEEKFKWNEWDLIIEPSAGSGNFYK